MNPGFTSHIVGVSEYESRGILDILYANRDYGDRHRVMHRITLRGDTSVVPGRHRAPLTVHAGPGKALAARRAPDRSTPSGGGYRSALS